MLSALLIGILVPSRGQFRKKRWSKNTKMTVSDYSLQKCADPNCSQRWHRLGDGKLFTFHLRDGRGRSTRHLWLCKRCVENWVAVVQREDVVLVPQKPKSQSDSHSMSLIPRSVAPAVGSNREVQLQWEAEAQPSGSNS